MPFTRSAKAREEAEVEAAKAASVVTAAAEPQSQVQHDAVLDEVQSPSQREDHVRVATDVDSRSALSGVFDEEMDVDKDVFAEIGITASTSVATQVAGGGPAFELPGPNVGIPNDYSMEIDSILADVIEDLSSDILATSDGFAKAVIQKASGNVAQDEELNEPQGIDGTQTDNGRQVPYNSATTVKRNGEEDKIIKSSRPETNIVVMRFSDKTAFGKKIFAFRNPLITREGEYALKQEYILQQGSTDEDPSTQDRLVVRKRKADTGK